MLDGSLERSPGLAPACLIERRHLFRWYAVESRDGDSKGAWDTRARSRKDGDPDGNPIVELIEHLGRPGRQVFPLNVLAEADEGVFRGRVDANDQPPGRRQLAHGTRHRVRTLVVADADIYFIRAVPG